MNEGNSTDSTDTDDTNPPVNKRRHRKSKDGTHIFIPHNIISSPSLAAYESRPSSSVTHTIGVLATSRR